MMTATHRMTAAAVGLGEVALVPDEVPAVVKVGMVLVCTYCGGLPDLDSPGSTPSRELGPVSQFLSAVVQFVSYLVQAFTGDRSATRGSDGVHRGFSHTWEWCAIVAGLVWVGLYHVGPVSPWSGWFALAVFSGSMAHIVLGDIFTPSGVPLSIIYNMVTPGRNWRRWRIPSGITTDHPSEHIIAMLAARVAVVVMALLLTGLPITPHTVIGAALVGAAWHWLVLSGLARRVLR